MSEILLKTFLIISVMMSAIFANIDFQPLIMNGVLEYIRRVITWFGICWIIIFIVYYLR